MVNRPAAPMARFGEQRSTRRSPLKLLCAAAVGGTALHSVLSFVGPSVPRGSGSAATAQQGRVPSVAAGSFSWDAEKPPELPQSPEEMMQQAADSVMRAYRMGITRQSVRFRLDELFDMDAIYTKGTAGLLNASLPAVQSFTRKLWGGQSLKKVRSSRADEDTSTLLYREAENPMQDAAVIYMPGREFMATSQTQTFFGNMKDRLVVLANTENSPSAFRVELAGKDWLDLTDIGYKMCNIFKEQSYYLYQGPFNQWKMTTFRAYPFPWQIFIETLDYKTILIGEWEEKPDYDQLIEKIRAYEDQEGVIPLKKVGKMLRDFRDMEEASEEANPGWRAAQSGDDIMEQSK